MLFRSAVTVLTNMMSMVTILVMVETITETKNTDKNTIKADVLVFCQSLENWKKKQDDRYWTNSSCRKIVKKV